MVNKIREGNSSTIITECTDTLLRFNKADYILINSLYFTSISGRMTTGKYIHTELR